LATPDKQYHKILTAKVLTPSFFKDSVETNKHTKEATSAEKSDQSSGFKLNADHCLNIFNSIKNFNEKGTLASPEKKSYFCSLEQINERDEDKLRKPKKKFEEDNGKDQMYLEGPPKSLKDIFKISNRNRKKNK
jgi:hypothetical protein